MTILVNGKPHPLSEGATVQDLVESLGLGKKRVAVEVNLVLVVRQEWASRLLNEGDRVEVVTFVGGG